MNKKPHKNLTNSLTQVFVSRANAVDGYWGMGQILREVQAQNLDVAVFDLQAKTCNLGGRTFQSLGEFMENKLAIYAARLGVSDDISAAKVCVTFHDPSPFYKTRHRVKLFRGRITADAKMFKCSAYVSNQRGQVWVNTVYDWCWPCNPAREHKWSFQ